MEEQQETENSKMYCGRPPLEIEVRHLGDRSLTLRISDTMFYGSPPYTGGPVMPAKKE